MPLNFHFSCILFHSPILNTAPVLLYPGLRSIFTVVHSSLPFSEEVSLSQTLIEIQVYVFSETERKDFIQRKCIYFNEKFRDEGIRQWDSLINSVQQPLRFNETSSFLPVYASVSNTALYPDIEQGFSTFLYISPHFYFNKRRIASLIWKQWWYKLLQQWKIKV